MAAILHTIFSKVFSKWTLMNVYKISLKCTLGSSWQALNFGPDNGVAPNSWEAIICTNNELGLLTHKCVTPSQQAKDETYSHY